MNFIEVFRQAFDSLRSNKLRSSLTLLAISVGVFAIISANTAVLVLDTYFKDTLSLMGGDVITVTKTPAISMGPMDWERFRNRQDITIDQMERLQDLSDQASEVGPNRTYRTTRVVFENEETEPNIGIRGGNEYYLDNNAYTLASGRNILPEDIDYARSVAIIGADVESALFENQDAIGKTIRIEGRRYTVIGVVEAKGNVFGSTLDRFVVVPYSNLAGLYGRNQNIGIQVRAGSVENIQNAIDEITGVLRVIRKVDPGEQNDFEITTNESLSSTFESFTGILYMIGFVIGGVVLLGAGIGVMNIMLVSVSERTREIGLRKSVGATRKAIVSQFLMETIAICQIGGVIGIIAGIGLGNVAALYLDANIVLPWGSAVGGIIGMTVIGVLFGVYPAYKAARLDPIESLRYE
ncbi:ABC transporter permease [Rhodohalobacter sp. SW132]|uniref:ABC transporter permease n=1 Tax=Rhodohalobacter sp. SW132 TaxID=2293433 RepID=UPI000E248385|nr:ABC transporter permease [Rhodohalobacter sp. SW132]REL38261.1 ABC transporter permease [Rhodohalobacter sp. SW132]